MGTTNTCSCSCCCCCAPVPSLVRRAHMADCIKFKVAPPRATRRNSERGGRGLLPHHQCFLGDKVLGIRGGSCSNGRVILDSYLVYIKSSVNSTRTYVAVSGFIYIQCKEQGELEGCTIRTKQNTGQYPSLLFTAVLLLCLWFTAASTAAAAVPRYCGVLRSAAYVPQVSSCTNFCKNLSNSNSK